MVVFVACLLRIPTTPQQFFGFLFICLITTLSCSAALQPLRCRRLAPRRDVSVMDAAVRDTSSLPLFSPIPLSNTEASPTKETEQRADRREREREAEITFPKRNILPVFFSFCLCRSFCCVQLPCFAEPWPTVDNALLPCLCAVQ